MAFSERMVLKKATNMSLHERFSQMRHEKITQPAAATAPKYSAPPVRSAPPMPRSPPLPPRISDYYDDENDSGILFTKFCYYLNIKISLILTSSRKIQKVISISPQISFNF